VKSTHLTEDGIETYCLNRLDESKLEEIETHLLLCQKCRRLVVEMDTYRASLREHLLEAAYEGSPRFR
jgi:anti-sigma factor RsiW